MKDSMKGLVTAIEREKMLREKSNAELARLLAEYVGESFSPLGLARDIVYEAARRLREA